MYSQITLWMSTWKVMVSSLQFLAQYWIRYLILIKNFLYFSEKNLLHLELKDNNSSFVGGILKVKLDLRLMVL
jgi:hypothetical protein